MCLLLRHDEHKFNSKPNCGEMWLMVADFASESKDCGFVHIDLRSRARKRHKGWRLYLNVTCPEPMIAFHIPSAKRYRRTEV